MSELPKQLDAVQVGYLIVDGNILDRDEDDTNLFERMDHALTTRYNAHEALEARMQQLEQALTLSKEALTATIQRVGTGYDWNVDPDCVTRLQGDAFEAITNALGQSDA